MEGGIFMIEKIIKKAKLSPVILIIEFISVVGWFFLPRDLIAFFTTKLIITNKKITGRTGLLNTNQLDSPLNKINGVQVKQGLLGKIFNYGTININTAANLFHFNLISNPHEFAATLNNQIEIYEEEKIERQARKLAEAVKN